MVNWAGDQTGKLFLVTGGYGGLGKETTISLLKAGATVYVGGRSQSTLDAFLTEQRKEHGDRIQGSICDLGDLASVNTFAHTFLAKHDKLDVLICNAGVMNSPKRATKQGHESQFGVNVIGHFLLTKLLVPVVTRVVFLSSVGHTIHGAARLNLDYYSKFDVESSEYDGWVQYQQSKLGDLLLAKAFHKFDKVEAASVHPGFINTDLNRDATLWLTKLEASKSVPQGAATQLFVALTPDIQNGAYYADCQVKTPHECATHEEDVDALYQYCEEVTREFQ